jgi:hypothetical protein
MNRLVWFHKKRYANHNFNVLSTTSLFKWVISHKFQNAGGLTLQKASASQNPFSPALPASRLAKPCCGASSSARRSLIPFEDSSARIRTRARGD